jgi:hypothetical protein
MQELSFPFRNKEVIGTTGEPDHYREIDLSSEVMIPIAQHPGAFGVTRKHHVHEGVDLYCVAGDEVYTMESGTIVAIIPFTGPHAGSPWWNDTFAILVEGRHGVINYGELIPRDGLKLGDQIGANELIGTITPVLTKDKGRPGSMLHLELYETGTREASEWKVGEPKPAPLKDPTGLLLRSVGDTTVD